MSGILLEWTEWTRFYGGFSLLCFAGMQAACLVRHLVIINGRGSFGFKVIHTPLNTAFFMRICSLVTGFSVLLAGKVPLKKHV